MHLNVTCIEQKSNIFFLNNQLNHKKKQKVRNCNLRNENAT